MPLPDLVKVRPRAPSAENSIAPSPPLPAAITSTPEPPIPAGNLMAKLGLVILFIGIGFLQVCRRDLHHSDRAALVRRGPGRSRAAGLGMAPAPDAQGARTTDPGTAIAILMLVIFSACQLYALIPSGLAFALPVPLTTFTCLPAVLQEAPWRAAFGITGGFASPVLLASGEGGSHVALFVCYALLNVDVFAPAFTRSWHPLNLLGFIFTFIIGAAWGGLR